MRNWYINKDRIIKSNPIKENIKDNISSKIYDTYKEALEALLLS